MKFPDKYKIIESTSYSERDYELIPIRYEDRLDIMHWRNAQIYHLRQKELLTEDMQNKYFQTVVSKLFNEENPDQILFSYLENGKCIGYGGLVHIDWYSKNAEISFIIDPKLEKDYFNLHWKMFLSLLYEYAFKDLNFHKIYTYAFDIRPYLYQALEEGGLLFEARLKDHFLFDGEFKDVVIHSKIRNNFYLRKAKIEDAKQLFEWVNEPSVRYNSFNTTDILWKDHLEWFTKKINSSDTRIYILEKTDNMQPLGQIRLDYSDKEDVWYIDYSIDKAYRKQNLAVILLELVKKELSKSQNLKALVKNSNIASIRSLQKAGYEESYDKENDCVVFKSRIDDK